MGLEKWGWLSKRGGEKESTSGGKRGGKGGGGKGGENEGGKEWGGLRWRRGR